MLVCCLFFIPILGNADKPEEEEKPNYGLNDVKFVGGGEDTPRNVLVNVAFYALYFLGAICTGLIIYAGFLWVIAAGNQEKITKARLIITFALIGLAVVLGAYMIGQLVASQFGVG